MRGCFPPHLLATSPALCRLVCLGALALAVPAWAQEAPDTEATAEPVPAEAPTSDAPAEPGPANTSEPLPVEGTPTDEISAEEPSVEELPPPPIATELERAKEAYFDGGHDEALRVLRSLQQRIDSGEIVAKQTRGDVGIYLGELLLLLKDQEGAWQTFRWLLFEYPDYPILPALHPPEVVSWFEAARAEVLAEIEANKPPPPPPTEPVPYPWWGYAPFGAPQLGQGFRGRGIALALGQGVAAGASIGTFAHLLVVNRRNHPSWLDDDEVAPYVRRWRNAVQWPSTALFYALWVVSVADGRRSWERAGHFRIVAGPTANGAELRLTGRFGSPRR
ncbi:MAG: hypothetical protein EP330_15120 [Deltaproteobacteria bacterium]|nr:MAG: hypothetical protein EP330_15120 [Deltaproteobacteria bacterium]